MKDENKIKKWRQKKVETEKKVDMVDNLIGC